MKKVLLGLALLSSVGIANADVAPNWNYVALSYQSAGIEGEDLEGEDLEGFGFSGSTLMGEDVFVIGAYSSVSTEIEIYREDVDLNLKSMVVGVGYRYGATEDLDVFGVISYQSAEVEASYEDSSGSVESNGNGLEIGIKSLLTPQLELTASVAYVATINDESETALSVSATYHLDEHFGIAAGYGQTEDVDTLSLSWVWFF